MIVKQAMYITGLSKQALIRYIDRGVLKAELKDDPYGGKYWDIEPDSFEAWWRERGKK